MGSALFLNPPNLLPSTNRPLQLVGDRSHSYEHDDICEDLQICDSMLQICIVIRNYAVERSSK